MEEFQEHTSAPPQEGGGEQPLPLPPLDIRIRSLNAPDVALQVFPEMKVSELKAVLEGQTSVPLDRQRLIYRGKVLRNESPLTEYEIESGHTVHLVPRPQRENFAGGNGNGVEEDDGVVESSAAAAAQAQAQAQQWPLPFPLGGEAAGGRGVGGGQRGAPIPSFIPIPSGSVGGGGLGSLGLGLGLGLGSGAAGIAAIHAPSTGWRRRRGGGGGGGSGPGSATTGGEGLQQEQSGSSSTSGGTDGGSLEHIRQGLLTVHTLLSAMRSQERSAAATLYTADAAATTAEEEDQGEQTYIDDTRRHRRMYVFPEEDLGEETRNDGSSTRSSCLQSRRFFVGQWLDVKDTVNQWLEATVMDMRESAGNTNVTELLIHYNGWPQRWDEWIACDSPRLAPFCTRTVWNASSGGGGGSHAAQGTHIHLSPASSFPHPPGAPATGRDDVRVLLPQLSSVLREVMPILGDLCNHFEGGLVDDVGDDGQDQEEQPRGGSVPLPWQPRRYDESQQGGSEAEDESARMARDLAPLFDRLGRIMSDMAPTLAALGRMNNVSESGGEDAPESGRGRSASRLISGEGFLSRTREASPSPDSVLRRLVHVRQPSPIPGSIDIHIHAIVPLRSSNNAAAAAGAGAGISSVGTTAAASGATTAAPNVVVHDSESATSGSTSGNITTATSSRGGAFSAVMGINNATPAAAAASSDLLLTHSLSSSSSSSSISSSSVLEEDRVAGRDAEVASTQVQAWNDPTESTEQSQQVVGVESAGAIDELSSLLSSESAFDDGELERTQNYDAGGGGALAGAVAAASEEGIARVGDKEEVAPKSPDHLGSSVVSTSSAAAAATGRRPQRPEAPARSFWSRFWHRHSEREIN